VPRVLPLLLPLLLGACFPYTGQPDDPTDSDPGTSGGVLTSGHPGWQDPSCWSCHGEDAHNSGLDPYGCVTCHGSNGAPSGHTDASPCSGCHGAPHGAEGFPDPESCQRCHPR
jgi:hypothetical protein